MKKALPFAPAILAFSLMLVALIMMQSREIKPPPFRDENSVAVPPAFPVRIRVTVSPFLTAEDSAKILDWVESYPFIVTNSIEFEYVTSFNDFTNRAEKLVRQRLDGSISGGPEDDVPDPSAGWSNALRGFPKPTR